MESDPNPEESSSRPKRLQFDPVDLEPQDVASLVQTLPALAKIARPGTMGDYFDREIKPFEDSVNSSPFNPSRERYLSVLKNHVERLYGPEKARDVLAENERLCVMEGTTHGWFPRDSSGDPGKDTELYPHQCMLGVAALAKRLGKRFVVYTCASTVNMNNSFSGGGSFAIVPEIPFPTASGNDMTNSVMFGRLKIDQEKYFNGSLLVTQLLALRKVMAEDSGVHEKQAAMVENLVKPVFNTNNNGKSLGMVSHNHQRMNGSSKSRLNDLMASYSSAIKERFGMDLDDISEEFAQLSADLDAPRAGDMSDQAALVQKRLYDKVVSPSGLEVIVVDASKIARDYLMEELCDKSSMMHGIFADPGLRKGFVETMAGVRSGWKAGDSPFVEVATSEKTGRVRLVPRPYRDEDHCPRRIADGLKEGKIMPSTAMMVVASLFADVLVFGGNFQSVYGTDARDALSGWLDSIGESSEAARIRRMPTDFTLTSQAFSYNERTGRPMMPGELRALDESERARLLEEAARLDSTASVVDYLGLLKADYEAGDPGFLKKPAPDSLPCKNDYGKCPGYLDIMEAGTSVDCGAMNICSGIVARKEALRKGARNETRLI